MGRFSLYRQIGFAGLSCVLLSIAVMLAPFEEDSGRAPALENAGPALLTPALSAVAPLTQQEGAR